MAGFFIAAVGVLEALFGIALFLTSQTTGTIVFGMGVITIALGVACVHLVSIKEALEKR